MSARFFWLYAAAAAALALGAACGGDDEETVAKPKPPEQGGQGPGGAGGAAPGGKLPGQHCDCDADCQGEGALCLLGMCVLRAAGPCAAPASEAGCAPGFLCFGADILPGAGTCWPLFDPKVCEGVQNRFGVCSPVRGETCDGACGSACAPDSVPDKAAGAACTQDSQCDLPEPTCYSDKGLGEPNGWVQGYCLMFGCEKDEQCGAGAGCFPVASDGSGVCMNRCQMDLDCRPGYVCRALEDAPGQMCFAGCDAAATCPQGYLCLPVSEKSSLCVDEKIACTPDNVYGWCPEGSWCDGGKCNDQPFACDGEPDALEPNDSLEQAVKAPAGDTMGLTLCQDNEDWYAVTVPAQTLVRVGIRFQNAAGDIDLVVYDAQGVLVGSRIGTIYPYASKDNRAYETGTEYYGLYSEKGGAKYYLRVVGFKDAENLYSLHVDEFPYVDGADCQEAGYSFAQCTGEGDEGKGLLPFPFPDPDDGFVGANYLWDTVSNYRFARRELIMLVRHALHRTYEIWPDAPPLGIIDICQIDGVTPGYDVGDPRHPETTHDQGGNADLAYFQTDGSNAAQIVCGDGSTHADGYCSPAAKDKHIVDLEQQAFFMAQLYSSSRVRVIGIDKVIGPLVAEAAKQLAALPDGDPKKITTGELNGFSGKMAYGSGWPYHHHHIHVSLKWWTGNDVAPPAEPIHRMERRGAAARRGRTLAFLP
ncbi:MAG: PPC domain-containing protein [Deltaproteobacteria bacterium]|nr:PPC domain-containing protein [Deltaproteobacteria bacterium]